jgi:dihydropteroate synthase
LFLQQEKSKRKTIMSTHHSPHCTHHAKHIHCGSRVLDLSRPQVMGILNITPDSFSDGGQFFIDDKINLAQVLKIATQMVADGAAIIDVGGESTRPNAPLVSSQQEMDRVLPVIEKLARELNVIISVDTSNPELMMASAALGAGLINDVRGLRRHGAIAAVAATGLPVCVMHMQGEPDTMQIDPDYVDVLSDVAEYLQQRVSACIEGGISRQKILLDPGFGFGKSVQHNLELLQRLTELADLGYPLLVGLSRKSLIGKITGRDVDQRLAGSIALATLACSKGARIIRAHDVRETVDAVKLYCAVNEAIQ